MKNLDILKKTMPFVWMRFLLYFLLGAGIVAYIALVCFLLISIVEGSALLIFGIIAFIVGIIIYTKLSSYIDYLVKAAHVAVIGELATKGQVPEGSSIVKYGQEKVKKRFVATTVFYGLNGLVSGAVKQIQKVITKVGNLFGNIKAVQNIVEIINLFIGIVLGYVDEAVLAHIFSKDEESAWKGAADGVVLYFQNWKAILKNAVGLVIFVILFYVVGMAAVYFLFYGIIATLFNETTIIAFLVTVVVAFCIISAIKQSFVDSWITISVVNRYMQVTANQAPQTDLYGKAKGWSKKFSNICSKAEAEGAVLGTPVAGATMNMPNQQVNNVQYQNNTMGQPMNYNQGMNQPQYNNQQVNYNQNVGQQVPNDQNYMNNNIQ